MSLLNKKHYTEKERNKLKAADLHHFPLPLWRCMPYILEKTSSGKWLILNRDYKPWGLAIDYSHTVDYSQFEIELDGVTEGRLRKMSFDGTVGSRDIAFYNDGCPPWGNQQCYKDYMDRLGVLLFNIKAMSEPNIINMVKE